MIVYQCRLCGSPSTSVELCRECMLDLRYDYDE